MALGLQGQGAEQGVGHALHGRIFLHPQRVGLQNHLQRKALLLRQTVEGVAPCAGLARQHQRQALQSRKRNGFAPRQRVTRRPHQISAHALQHLVSGTQTGRVHIAHRQVHTGTLQAVFHLAVQGLGDGQSHQGVMHTQRGQGGHHHRTHR